MAFCNKHLLESETVDWAEALEEIEEKSEWEGEVCPLCYASLYSKLKKARRSSRSESRKLLAANRKLSSTEKEIGIITETIEQLSGKSIEELMAETGSTQRGLILSNLISEMFYQGGK